MSNNEQDYEMCFRVENVMLPKRGYFGVTAATGGLAGDNQIVIYCSKQLF
jgi:mannose-binding lectin 1